MLNSVILAGRLTKDAEKRSLPSGSSVVSFSIAINRKYKDRTGEVREEAHYFDVEKIVEDAEKLLQALKKGVLVAVEGQLRQQRWETKEGNKASKTIVFANKITLLSKKENSQAEQIPHKNVSERSIRESIESDLEDDEDLPF